MAEAKFSDSGQIQIEKVLKFVDGDFLLIHRRSHVEKKPVL